MTPRALLGVLLILLGGFLFMNKNATFVPADIYTYFWPSLFILPLGIFFHWLYFSLTERKYAGLLVPGGILLTVGAVCQIAMLYDAWGSLWPGFILAPAVGLFELYWFGGRNKWLLIPIAILTAVSLLFFTVFSIGVLFTYLTGNPLLAIGLIVVGAFLLLGRKSRV